MQNIISYNFNLLEIFVNVINHKYYIVISAKYHSSNVNDACTVSPTDMLAALQKLYS